MEKIHRYTRRLRENDGREEECGTTWLNHMMPHKEEEIGKEEEEDIYLCKRRFESFSGIVVYSDIFWLRHESLEDTADLPDPNLIVAEMLADLEAALKQLQMIAADVATDGQRING